MNLNKTICQLDLMFISSTNFPVRRHRHQGFRQGGLDPPLPYLAPKGGYPPVVGKGNKNIFYILMSFQLK